MPHKTAVTCTAAAAIPAAAVAMCRAPVVDLRAAIFAIFEDFAACR
jgi:hypothetical protein